MNGCLRVSFVLSAIFPLGAGFSAPHPLVSSPALRGAAAQVPLLSGGPRFEGDVTQVPLAQGHAFLGSVLAGFAALASLASVGKRVRAGAVSRRHRTGVARQ